MVNLPKGVSCDQCRYLSVSESLGLEVSTRIFTPGLSLAFGSQELEFLMLIQKALAAEGAPDVC